MLHSEKTGQNVLEMYQAYVQSTEGIWMFETPAPVSIDQSPESLITFWKENCILAECNDNMAKMYGFEKREDLLGIRLSELQDFSNPDWIATLKRFIANKFILKKFETREKDKFGNVKYFLNNVTGIIDNGMLQRIWGTQLDISDKKNTESLLQQSELFYKNLIAESLDGIILTDENGIISFASQAISSILGFSPEEVVSREIFEFAHPDDREWAIATFRDELLMQQRVKFINIRLINKKNEWIWCMVRGHNMFGNPYIGKMAVYFSDDSLRKKAEDELIENKKMYKEQANILNNVTDVIITTDLNRNITSWNKIIENLTGITANEAIGRRFREVFESSYAPFTHDEVAEIVIKEGVWRGEMSMNNKNGEKIYILHTVSLIKSESGENIGLLGIGKDITEQKRLSDKLLQQVVEKQKLLVQATIDGQEKERQEIGKELHDNINQYLTTARLYLEVAKEKSTGEVHEMIRLSHKTLSDIVKEIRKISQSLVPPTLGDIGLIESIKELCDSIKQAHPIQIDFQYPYFSETRLTDNMKLMLFRIVQEQFNNIIRHSEATWMEIKLQEDAENLSLLITDNGKGFDTENYKRGRGLSNINSRANIFNGRVEIDASPGHGCRIAITIPHNPE